MSVSHAGLVPSVPQFGDDAVGQGGGKRNGDGWLVDLSFSTDYTSRASSAKAGSSDWITEPGYRIARNYEGPNVSFNTRIKHEWVNYHRDTFSRDRNIDGTTLLKIHPKGQRWRLSLAGVSKQVQNEVDLPNTPDNQSQSHQLRALPSYVLPLQSNSRLYFSGAFIEKRFLEDSPRSDVITRNLSTTWQHNFNYEESMQLRFSNVHGNFKNSDTADFAYNEALFSVTGFITRLRYTLNIGLNEIRRDDDSEKETSESGGIDFIYIYDGAYFNGGFQKEIASSGLFGTLTDFGSETAGGGLGGIGGGGGFGDSPDGIASGDGSEFDSSLDFEGINAFADQDVVTQERVYLSWPYYRPNEDWSFSFFSVLSKDNYDRLDLDAETFEFRFGARYLMGSGKTLGLQINYVERDFENLVYEDFSSLRFRWYIPGYSHNKFSINPNLSYVTRRQDGAGSNFNEFSAGVDLFYILR